MVSVGDKHSWEREGGLEKCRDKTNASARKIAGFHHILIQREKVLVLFVFGRVLSPAGHWDLSPCFSSDPFLGYQREVLYTHINRREHMQEETLMLASNCQLNFTPQEKKKEKVAC